MADQQLDVAEFLFPKDLEITPTGIRNVLFIGSCLSEAYVKFLRTINPDTNYEHILFNNAADLPVRTDAELRQYDLQYIQIPLRSVLTDAIARPADNDKSPNPVNWLQVGRLNIDRMLEKALIYNKQVGLLSFVAGFIVPQGFSAGSLHELGTQADLRYIVQSLNDYVIDKVRDLPNALYVDVDMIGSALGKMYFLDDFIFFYTHGSVHYEDWGEGGRIDQVPPFVDTYQNKRTEFLRAISRQIEALYRTAKQIDQVKVVIFDLDNTLWRGQLVEDYQPGAAWPHSAGWPMGVWEAVQHLRWRGIAVALASKNDKEIVIAKWRDAVDLPYVSYEDFVVSKVNWNPKSENIKEILGALSLTPKSAVFVDDHPVERESVRATLPGIRTIGSNPYLTRRILLWSPETQLLARTKESKRREAMFRTQIDREEHRKAVSQAEFLASLGAKLSVWEIVDTFHHSYTRVSELVNKTNQFNTTGKRWDAVDYTAFLAQGGHVFAFSVADRFSDYGTVGVVFVTKSEIVQFVMSCRVLGMNIESAALSTLIGHMRERLGAKGFRASIVPTEANMPCRDVFLKSGFAPETPKSLSFVLSESQAPKAPRDVKIDFQPAVSG